MIMKGLFTIKEAGLRLDEAAAILFPELSRTRIRRIIDMGGCAVNETMSRVASRQVREGDRITLGVMESGRFQDLVFTGKDIIYEDGDLLAIGKPAGFSSQRTPYQLKGTVEHAVGVYMKEKGIGEPVRIVHRLDRGTSGVMLFPKNRATAARLSALLKGGLVEKRYLALVSGKPGSGEWVVDQPLAKIAPARYGVATPGKESRTEFRILRAERGVALVEGRPLTGRTHQVRVHLAFSKLPIVGDSTYGGEKAQRLMLHCRSMAFEGGAGKLIHVSANPGPEFLEVCRAFGLETEDLQTEKETADPTWTWT